MSFLKSRNSFDRIKDWHREAQDNVNQDVVFILVGNKTDLNEQRQVSYEEGIELMNELNLDMFFETSAKANTEIVRMFYESAQQIHKIYKEIKSYTDLKTVNLYQEKKKKTCC